MAAERKHEKYTELEKSYVFQPISFETFGPINSSGHFFISELGRRILCRQFLVMYVKRPFYTNVYPLPFSVLMQLLFVDVLFLQTWTRNHPRI